MTVVIHTLKITVVRDRAGWGKGECVCSRGATALVRRQGPIWNFHEAPQARDDSVRAPDAGLSVSSSISSSCSRWPEKLHSAEFSAYNKRRAPQEKRVSRTRAELGPRGSGDGEPRKILSGFLVVDPEIFIPFLFVRAGRVGSRARASGRGRPASTWQPGYWPSSRALGEQRCRDRAATTFDCYSLSLGGAHPLARSRHTVTLPYVVRARSPSRDREGDGFFMNASMSHESLVRFAFFETIYFAQLTDGERTQIMILLYYIILYIIYITIFYYDI